MYGAAGLGRVVHGGKGSGDVEVVVEEALRLFRAARGVVVMSQDRAGGYPTPGIDASRSDAVFVGRVREDISHEQGLSFWVVADNVRKGAALNAVQIAELLIRDDASG